MSKMSASNKTGNISGIICKFEKNSSCSKSAIALSMIKSAYENSIEYTAIAKGTRGILTTMIFLFSIMFIGIALYIIQDTLKYEKQIFLDYFWIALAICMIGSAVVMNLCFVRLEIFSPIDLPIVFDRKNRKVYRIYRYIPSGLKGAFQAWPIRTTEYEWVLIDAEHHARLEVNTNTVQRHHSLVFNVRKSETDDTIVDTFTIGNSLLMGEFTTPAVWEHIRRFMEEDGPHLAPGEALLACEKPATIKHHLQSVWKGIKDMWNELRFVVIMGLAFFPLSFPILISAIFFSWLSYKTSYSVNWPNNVKAAIGTPISSIQYN